MSELTHEIAAFEEMRAQLEDSSMGKWVVFHEGELAAIADSFERAAEEAVRRFGAGPYLIRQVGAPPMAMPVSVMYDPPYGADDPVRFQQWAGRDG